MLCFLKDMCYNISMNLTEKLKQLPTNSGVYIYYDANGKVLYVGKAKNLKNRVKQYFSASTNKPYKVQVMLRHVVDMDYILTESETDAFALENNLIKKYTPPFNILLKDDKQYPFVKINTKEDFPRISYTRKVLPDGAKYFGPIMHGVRETLELLSELYPTRTCNANLGNLPKNFRPCLNYHIGKCSAPCIGKISREEYGKLIEQSCDFLRGETQAVKKMLFNKMTQASQDMQYEQALKYRKQLELVEKISETKVAMQGKIVDYDVFSVCCNGTQSAINVTLVREGKIIYSKSQTFADASIDEEQTLAEFLNAYYGDTNDVAKEILLNKKIESMEEFGEFLTVHFGKKITLSVAERGQKRRLVDMSYANAKEHLEKSFALEERKYASTAGAVTQLQQMLGLKRLPNRIECYDISNVSGVDKVSSMVVAIAGEKSTKDYRRFKIKTVDGANDFACMKETLLRRFERLNNGDQRFGAKPDLIVIDGGLGQLKYALEARDQSGVDVEMISLAEREELVYVEGDNQPRRLPRDSFALKLLINTRDEAHRFAVSYFRNLHGKNALSSQLSQIEGVGKKRLLALQKRFKGIQAIKNATVEDIAQTEGISPALAEKIHKFVRDL